MRWKTVGTDGGLQLRTVTSTRLLWAPRAGQVETTVTASLDRGCMLAVWLVGTEHEDARHSGEVCVFEIGPRDADSSFPKTAMVHRVRCA